MITITPAYLAEFVHRVPVNAIIPAGTEHACRNDTGFRLVTLAYDHEQAPGALDRWTAVPILTAEQQRLEDGYAAACEAILDAGRAVVKAREEAEALRPRAERLYRELQKAGRR